MIQNFFALPPELNSACLSTGPGVGSMLSASEAWTAISAEYLTVADELRAILSAVQFTLWEGPSAERFVSSHLPYLIWLERAAADTALAAQSHLEAAAGFAAAAIGMPTAAELAANHVAHAALLSTNLFGINTIPLALNEADYSRMWVQAAEAMTIYDAVATNALQQVRQTPPAPVILSGASAPFADAAGDPSAEAAVSGQALGQSNLLLNGLLDSVRMLSAPLNDLIRQLAALDLEDLLRLLITDPAAAAGALSSVGTALLAYAIWQTTIASIVWGSMLLAPALAIPLGASMQEAESVDPEHDPIPSDREPVTSIPERGGSDARLPIIETALGAMPGTIASPPPPAAASAPTVTTSGPSPTGPPAALYAFAMRPEGPNSGPGQRPWTTREGQPSAGESEKTRTPAPAAAPQLPERRSRRRSARRESPEPMRRHEVMEVDPDEQADRGQVTPRGGFSSPMHQNLGTTAEPLLPTTWTGLPS